MTMTDIENAAEVRKPLAKNMVRYPVGDHIRLKEAVAYLRSKGDLNCSINQLSVQAINQKVNALLAQKDQGGLDRCSR